MKDIVLVMTWDHPNLVTQNFSTIISASFESYNQRVVQISVSKPINEQFVGIDFSSISAIFCIGHEPLAIRINNSELYNAIDCPFYVYVLDTPIYNLRNPALVKFLNDSTTNKRLHVLFAEQSYIDLYSRYELNHNKPNISFMPFAGFPNINKKVPKLDRAVVVGGLGTQLSTFSDTLIETINNSNPYDADESELENLNNTINSESFNGNVTRAIIDNFNLPASELVDTDFLTFACSLDSFIKHRNRIKAIDSLKGFPTDFYGPGWDSMYKDVPEFNFMGEISHTDISRIINQYKIAINFDPNWENGVHDRVFTTLGCGSSLITNKNDFLSNVDGKIYTYSINNPNLKELAETACAEYTDSHNTVLLNHSWYERVTKLIQST